MRVVKTRAELHREVSGARAAGKRIGFVPTMGALHEGHLSLIRLARSACNYTVVSIFVNPTQFGPNEDFLRYPRPIENDCRLLDAEQADLVYLPSVKEVYGDDAAVTVNPGPIGGLFEGAQRPGHFQGVLTVVAKLFNQVQPDVSVFGQKDAQQLFLIRKMVKDLDFPVEIIEGATVRSEAGLALSSRNAYLKVSERAEATRLHGALSAGRSYFDGGGRSLAEVKAVMSDAISALSVGGVDYLTAVGEHSFSEEEPLPDEIRLIGAIRLGSVRLIDNLQVRSSN